MTSETEKQENEQEQGGLIDPVVMCEKVEFLKWKLADLAASNEEDIDCNELEIYGEDGEGREGYCTVKITDIAQEAYDTIKELQLNLTLSETAHRNTAGLLVSCEAALQSRDFPNT